MAPHTQLATMSSEDSFNGGGKKRLLKSSTSSLIHKKRDSSLPSSPDSQSTPYGKTHAGEVRRRSNRQTDPLPAPGIGQSGSGGLTNGSSREPRRRNGANNGGYNSDSDSDEDRRRHKSDDGPDDAVAIARREKRPDRPSLHYAEASNRSHVEVHMDEEELFRRSMQRSLTLIGEKLVYYISPNEQRSQMSELLRSTSSGTRPGAIRSETYDLMLEYLKNLEDKVLDSHTTALMRQQTSPSSEDYEEKPWKRYEFSHMIRVGKVTFKYVQLYEVPSCVMDLPGFSESATVFGPIVLRVLVKQNTPRYAEVVSTHLLEDLGWWFSDDTGNWCHHHVERNKLGSVIYQRDITGRITKKWEISDADKHLEFQRFLADQRAVEESYNGEESEETETRV